MTAIDLLRMRPCGAPTDGYGATFWWLLFVIRTFSTAAS
jgi:hypothetical protein